jgi:hypothetical protein
MQRKLVPVEFGHLPVEYFSSGHHHAELRDFPNAREYSLTLGLSLKPLHEKKLKYVCPECRRAEQQWLLKHPHDEWGQLMSHPSV